MKVLKSLKKAVCFLSIMVDIVLVSNFFSSIHSKILVGINYSLIFSII